MQHPTEQRIHQLTKTATQQSKATRIQILFKKYGGLKGELKVSKFQEPIMFLIRRSGRVEFYQDATSGLFAYVHSDGTQRNLILDTRYILTFDYGKKEFRGYICHEDHPLPLPEDPLVTSEQVQIIIEKTLSDYNKWKAQEAQGKAKILVAVAIVIGVIIGGIILYKILVPAPTPTIDPEVIKQAVETATRSATVLD